MIEEETVPTVRRRRRTFPEAFKREAAERAETSGMTIIAVADELGVHETLLRRKIKAYRQPGGAAFPGQDQHVRVGFTAAQSAELWARWQRGEALAISAGVEL